MKTNDSVESVTLLSNPHVALHAGGMMDDYHGLRGVSLVVEGASPVPNAEQLAIALENLVKRIGKRESCFVIDLNIPEVEDSWSHGPSRLPTVEWTDPLQSYRFCADGAHPTVQTENAQCVADHVVEHLSSYQSDCCALTVCDGLNFSGSPMTGDEVILDGMIRPDIFRRLFG